MSLCYSNIHAPFGGGAIFIFISNSTAKYSNCLLAGHAIFRRLACFRHDKYGLSKDFTVRTEERLGVQGRENRRIRKHGH